MSSFTDALITRRLDDGKKWAVERFFDFFEYPNCEGPFARVEAGFVTDLTSRPAITNMIVPKTGKYDQASVVHDMGYRYNVIFEHFEALSVPYVSYVKDRKYWDKLYYSSMLVLGTNRFRAKIIYFGVRTFGGRTWKKHRKAEKEHPFLKMIRKEGNVLEQSD